MSERGDSFAIPASENLHRNGLMHRSKSRYSITSSSAAERDNGTVRPSALAVLRLINIDLCGLLDWQVGRILPLRIRPV
jgi:hypothetical protein